ncbi:MAG: hypothetical protein MK212_03560 [Saprospiraceae bacterium]|nr:hypothetical protein [Saprospiraceae bacterium]
MQKTIILFFSLFIFIHLVSCSSEQNTHQDQTVDATPNPSKNTAPATTNVNKNDEATEAIAVPQPQVPSCGKPSEEFLGKVLGQMKEEFDLGTEKDAKIEGVLNAQFSSATEAEYIAFSSMFYAGGGAQMRVLAKIACDGESWKVTGMIDYAGFFTPQSLIDIDNDGIHELVEEGGGLHMGTCFTNYNLYRWQGAKTKQLFSNHATSLLCGGGLEMAAPEKGEVIETEFEMSFEDKDGDKVLELVEKKMEGVLQSGTTEEDVKMEKTESTMVYKYDATQGKYIQL